jgi:hypothetical protein
MKFRIVLILLLGWPGSSRALDSLGVANLALGGFVDLYYAYDSARLPSGDRSFTTQPLRHNEFNLNLAVIDLRYRTPDARGRVALQTGTYVHSNYAAESALLQHIHEASAGFRAGGTWWIDMGVLPSHIGFESAISRENWTYSRSLMAEYSPYYETGIRVGGSPSAKVSVAALLLNGWQNIRETNGDKALGWQIQVRPNDRLLLNWSTFLGNEAPDSVSRQDRFFQNAYLQVGLPKGAGLALVADLGIQKRPAAGRATWYAAALMAQVPVSRRAKVGVRFEYYADRDQVLVATGLPEGFRTFGASANLDLSPADNFVVRLEARGFRSRRAVYPTPGGLRRASGFIATSFALSF